MWRLVLIVCILTAYRCDGRTQQHDDGLSQLLASNTQEFSDNVIECDRSLPNWLSGVLVRNGPGTFGFGERNLTHLLDGFAKLHSIKFQPGRRPRFTAKFISSKFYQQSLLKNDIVPFAVFGDVKPPYDARGRIEQLMNGIDNHNIHVVKFGSRRKAVSLATLDFLQFYTFDVHSLATLNKVKPTRSGAGNTTGSSNIPPASSAHPLPEANSLNYITFMIERSLTGSNQSTVSLIRLKSPSQYDVIASFQVDGFPYMHSFALSKNYAILSLSPAFKTLPTGIPTQTPLEGLRWYSNKKTVLHVINIHTGQMMSVETEAVFPMHHVNAFETGGGNIIMDVVTYEDVNGIFNLLQMEILRDPTLYEEYFTQPSLKRFSINTASKTVQVHTFESSQSPTEPNHFDLPIINEAYRYKEYCYIYGWAQTKDRKMKITKKDVCHGRDLVWQRENHLASESWFVATPGATREDDGLLLNLVYDAERKRTYLAVLDAEDFTMRNKCYLPTTIPYSVHGRFF